MKSIVEACECGGALAFDATVEGETVGGLHLIGWDVCTECRKAWLSRRGVPGGGKWAVASSGRSVVADSVKLRAEAGQGDPRRLLERIARLPSLEAALREIARGAADPAAVARRALECVSLEAMSNYTWSEARGQQPPAPPAAPTDTLADLRLRRISELAYAAGAEPLDRRDLVVILEGDEAMVREQLGKPAPFTPGIEPIPTDPPVEPVELNPASPPPGQADIPAATRRGRRRKPAPAAAPAEPAPAEPAPAAAPAEQLGLTAPAPQA